jgi:hypothetical protein
LFFFFRSGVYFIKIYSENILPHSVQIFTDNQKITNALYLEIYKELSNSKNALRTRTQFVDKIKILMNSYDIIDRYWIRLGLDGKLQIHAIMQIPMMVIEAKDKERYIVSRGMEVIAKNPLPHEYHSLLKIEVPELKINWKSKSRNVEVKKKVDSSKRNSEENNPVNYPWLLNQSHIINSRMLKIGTGYSLEKISWSSQFGFILTVNRNLALIESSPVSKKNDQNVSKKDTFTVFLGENQIKEKLDRLKSLLLDLSHKNIYPSKVDLEFFDKATFKAETAILKLSR